MADADVVVIGAGAAGLAAAAELRAARRRFVVLEAQDRIGGRVLTVHDPRVPVPLELGAEFVHGDAPETARLAREAGCALIDVTGEHWQVHGKRVRRVEDLWSRIGRVLDRLDENREPDRSFAGFLADRPGGRSMARDRTRAAAFVQGFHAADLDRASERALAPGDEPAAEQASRIARVLCGYDRLLRHLVESAGPAVMLGTAVRRVEWAPGEVVVHARDARGRETGYSARACIVTLPLGVLQAKGDDEGAVTFDPPLPDATRTALGGLVMGSVVRATFVFDEPFWTRGDIRALSDGEDLRRMSFLHLDGRPWSVFWTQAPLRLPLLTAWAGGPPAAQLAALSVDEVVASALDALAASLSMRRRSIERRVQDVLTHDWQNDAYARGAYSYAAVGGADAHRALSRPVRGTLFFAGEAADAEGRNGTVEGALASGRAAAKRAVRR